jgi:hypothetical protein
MKNKISLTVRHAQQCVRERALAFERQPPDVVWSEVSDIDFIDLFGQISRRAT